MKSDLDKKNKLPPKLRPHLPRGLADWEGSLLALRNDIASEVAAECELFGYARLETPMIENLSALGDFLPDADRPRHGVFALRDDDDSWLALRYDLTAPLARFVAANRSHLYRPYRSYRSGAVFRNEKPGPARFRQFMQSDADILWASAPQGDAEICELAYKILTRLTKFGIDFSLRINHRKILNAALAKLSLHATDEAGEQRNGVIMRALDKLDRVGIAGVRALLGAGRMDASGDYTAGAGLHQEQIDALAALVDARGADNAATLARLTELVGGIAQGDEALSDLHYLCEHATRRQFADERFVLDPSIVRGLGYYTGVIFEAVARTGNAKIDASESSAATGGDSGEAHASSGAIGGGGRYDGLVSRFGGEPVPACGLSIGTSRMAAMIHRAGLASTPRRGDGPSVVVLALDDEARINCDRIVDELRNLGISTATFIGGSGMRAKLRFADRCGARFAIMEGDAERAAGVLAVKDLQLGKQLADNTAQREVWRQHSQQANIPLEEVADYIVQNI